VLRRKKAFLPCSKGIQTWVDLQVAPIGVLNALHILAGISYFCVLCNWIWITRTNDTIAFFMQVDLCW
jgi:hypothetical protein